MNPKTLQYLTGHSEISVTMDVYTHLGLDDAKDEIIRLKELEDARKEINSIERDTMHTVWRVSSSTSKPLLH